MQEAADLAQRVLAALAFQGCIAPRRFPIAVKAGEEALVLEGQVESVQVKRSAVRVASEFSGAEGLALDDRLQVALAAPRADGDMLDALGDALLASPELTDLSLRRHHRGTVEVLRSCPSPASGELEFAVREGVVELAGSVPSLSHRRLAEVLAWWIGGCRNVVNRLRVDPAERDSDDELTDAVGLVLEVDPALPEAQPIGVAAEGGVVTLTGGLLTETQRQRAEYDTWCVEGVGDVRNEITVAA